MAEQDLRRVYKGTATLDETKRACENAQMRRFMQVKNIQRGIAEIDGGEMKVNVADFKSTPIGDILDVLKFIDLSTNPVQAVADTNIAINIEGFKEIIKECQIFVGEQVKKVKVLGKKSDSD